MERSATGRGRTSGCHASSMRCPTCAKPTPDPKPYPNPNPKPNPDPHPNPYPDQVRHCSAGDAYTLAVSAHDELHAVSAMGAV